MDTTGKGATGGRIDRLAVRGIPTAARLVWASAVMAATFLASLPGAVRGQDPAAPVAAGAKPGPNDRQITLAVKSFLRRNGHRNKPAAPSGHLSVWMESAQLSPVALKAAAALKP